MAEREIGILIERDSVRTNAVNLEAGERLWISWTVWASKRPAGRGDTAGGEGDGRRAVQGRFVEGGDLGYGIRGMDLLLIWPGKKPANRRIWPEGRHLPCRRGTKTKTRTRIGTGRGGRSKRIQEQCVATAWGNEEMYAGGV